MEVIAGYTKEGKAVVKGEVVFRGHDQLGLPWDMVFGFLSDHDLLPDLVGLSLILARKYGWSNDRIVSEIGLPVRETYGTRYYEQTIGRMF